MKCRQNWSVSCETELNNQIVSEYEASLAYHSLANYFDRDDVGIQKMVDFFNESSLEEREHADKLMKYQNMRGGFVVLKNINSSSFNLKIPTDIVHSFEIALELEKNINSKLLNLHKIAEENNDPQFCDFLEGEFLKEQVESISKISKILSVLKRFNGDQHAIWNYLEKL